MARNRKEESVAGIKLRQPDRSGPDPGQATLLDMAKNRNLFEEAERRQAELDKQNGKVVWEKDSKKKKKKDKKKPAADDDEVALPPGAERFVDGLLWTSCIAMLHFTFDVLVQNQYAMTVEWPTIWARAGRAWILFIILFYPIHPHTPDQVLIPGIPKKYQYIIRQSLFFLTSAASGSYLVYISNNYGYLHVMKQAPPLGCLWVWAVLEMDLPFGVPSLLVCFFYAVINGYGFT